MKLRRVEQRHRGSDLAKPRVAEPENRAYGHLESLPARTFRAEFDRGLSRDGNATAVETLVQSDAESGSIHVLVLITVDLFAGWMDIRAELQGAAHRFEGQADGRL